MSEKEKSYVYFWSVKDEEYSCFSQWYLCEFEEEEAKFVVQSSI